MGVSGGVVNHETHERHERRERGSWVSRPFVPFVFQTAIHKFERSRAQQREAQRQAEHLLRTLLYRRFGGYKQQAGSISALSLLLQRDIAR